MSDASVAIRRRSVTRFPELALAVAAIAVFALWPPVHALDLRLEAYFFDRAVSAWLVPPDSHGLLFWLFYRGPKLALAAAGAASLLWLLRCGLMQHWRSFETRLLLALSVLGITALLAGLLKGWTGISCPVQETIFAGPYAHVAVLDRLQGIAPFNEHFRCWPAGHAAAGFGLLGFRLFAPGGAPPSWRYLAPGLAGGWVLGIYQMARGQHYLSHTVVTMALAFLLSSLAIMILDCLEDRG
ncbi:phosphatase PAP2 family protein [Parvibaculum sp.]|uniref:phosphatase PAP2 family protein n=1 Tax=Parvibaculum sp. TaxID=2024848 RepID=UPI001B07EEDA|nr:phosphatase PAP2 family protein [Parvibaculum sp.]MBO6633028.1 phosphatase PAP2 family protein [Parvibaculum sp.]MBO6679365.1 phosphatase PAP2 family protein [Parvibaculum sp.]MBO6684611.1 phosphatase PAP2 family protein [Parvibaculum sp.]MBO6904523.1 phosphatase PAP2 family protein [Parvibaculum sp.]